MGYPINSEGVSLLKSFENFVGFAYPDPISPLGKALQTAGLWREALGSRDALVAAIARTPGAPGLDGAPWTIGWGFTEGVHIGDVMSQAEADNRLGAELSPIAEAVTRACRMPPNENQLAAMVVCAFNIGVSGFIGSTMLRAHNAGDFQSAARAFGLWNKSRGAVVSGLTRRRAAESALYLKPVHGFVDVPGGPQPMPQRVDPETSLLKSPIVWGTGASGAAGAMGLAGDAARTFSDVRYSLGDIFPYVLLVLIAVLVGGVGVVIWNRWRQRKNGWA